MVHSCCCGGGGRTTNGDMSSRYGSSPYGPDGGNVTEKHYGCYKVGILFSIIIILLLLLGCVPIFFLTHDNNLILLILLVTLILIGIITYAYFRWQHRKAQQMRRSCEEQKMNLTRVGQPHAGRPNNGAIKQNPTDASQKVGISNGNNTTVGSPPRYSFI
ncbi:uncharacterized protein LOC129747726 [Uranotaenia lowii]|uniref:uncharacterized protein LOC129747726 n=1 Tax=Uranotaenia lowii TaxID=190385 RepID=UPI00247910C1|nr:uncharacterized protein LOC129747726 [Uranotaenia lowii]XP_055598038.1 uncharacterized protein LOC129747726 [Uranotaenia lowii]XP_055598039.1 uncharacterized protein LOC129747726 [Uranotaenia lowii]XP_055598040.1 uncharacterized protein LOC129747726 [Uranotaenia lowii]